MSHHSSQPAESSIILALAGSSSTPPTRSPRPAGHAARRQHACTWSRRQRASARELIPILRSSCAMRRCSSSRVQNAAGRSVTDRVLFGGRASALGTADRTRHPAAEALVPDHRRRSGRVPRGRATTTHSTLSVSAVGAKKSRAWAVLWPNRFCSATAAKLAVMAQTPTLKIQCGRSLRQIPPRPSTMPIPVTMAASWTHTAASGTVHSHPSTHATPTVPPSPQ